MECLAVEILRVWVVCINSRGCAFGSEGGAAAPFAYLVLAANGTHIDIIGGERIEFRQAVWIVLSVGDGGCCVVIRYDRGIRSNKDIPCGLAVGGPSQLCRTAGDVGGNELRRGHARRKRAHFDVVNKDSV